MPKELATTFYALHKTTKNFQQPHCNKIAATWQAFLDVMMGPDHPGLALGSSDPNSTVSQGERHDSLAIVIDATPTTKKKTTTEQ